MTTRPRQVPRCARTLRAPPPKTTRQWPPPDDNAKRAGQPKKVGEYSGRGVRATTAPSDSDGDPDSSVNKAATPRATDKADEATRDGA